MKIALYNITKTLNGKELFTDFSLEIHQGMRLCICGHNGVGKSVLMRIIAQKEDVDAGTVSVPKEVHIGYGEQEIQVEDLTVPLLDFVLSGIPHWQSLWDSWEKASRDNSVALESLTEKQHYLEMRFGYTPEQYCKQILFGLGFCESDLTKQLSEFSGGFRERAKLARILSTDADILLLDEPINHLDIEAIEWLENFLLHFHGIVVFIAHDRVFMDTVSTHTLYLGTKKPFFLKGSYSKVIDELHATKQQAKQSITELSKEIARQESFINKFKAKPSKASQANSRKKSVEKLKAQLANITVEKNTPHITFTFPTPERGERTLVTLDSITKSYTKPLWANLSAPIYNDSKIAIVGANGAGKSTLLKCILGTLAPDNGRVLRSASAKIGYFSQHQSDILDFSRTVLEEMRRFAAPYTDDATLMHVLGRFLLGQSYFERIVGSLSGGEKNRLILASLFLAKNNLLLLDEPTNHLDLETRESLTSTLQQYTGSILLVAHDRYLLRAVAQEFWLPTNNGFIIFYSYDDYMQYRLDTADTTPTKKEVKHDRKKQRQEEALQRELRYKARKPKEEMYKKLEQEVEQLYSTIHTLEIELSTPAVYENSAVLQEKMQLLHRLKQEVQQKMEQLIQLDEELALL